MVTLTDSVANAASSKLSEASASKPNIVVILVDDMGFADLSVTGCKEWQTPHIDRLCEQGMNFTAGSVSASQCGPSRAGLIGGVYQQRIHMDTNLMIDRGNSFPKGMKTFAEYMLDGGYRTGMVGKWHLGHDAGQTPNDRGFEYFYGFLGGTSWFLPQTAVGEAFIHGILENDKPIKETRYLTDALTTHAIDFVNGKTESGNQKKKPFFLYMSYNAPHVPLEAPQEYIDKFPELADRYPPVKGGWGKYLRDCNNPGQVYAAMMANLDDNIGRFMENLKAQGLDQNTLVFFLSDNGAPRNVISFASNKPFRGVKGDVLEGGIHVPFFAHWPAVISPNSATDVPVSSLDLIPTAMALSGQKVAKSLDGVSLLPLLKSAGTLPSRTLFWKQMPNLYNPEGWAVRNMDFKLVAETNYETTEPVSRIDGLYQVSDDLREDRDLSGSHPERLIQLKAAWDRWNDSLPKSMPSMLPGGIRPFAPDNCTIIGKDVDGKELLFTRHLFDDNNGSYSRFHKLKGAKVTLEFKEPVTIKNLVLSSGGWGNWAMVKKVHITVNGSREFDFEMEDLFAMGGCEDLRALQQVAIDQKVKTLKIAATETTYATQKKGHQFGGFAFIGMTNGDN